MIHHTSAATLGAGRSLPAVAALGILTLGLIAAGRASAAVITIDPDEAAADQVVNTFFAPRGVALATDDGDRDVYAVENGPGLSFGWQNQGYSDGHWARPSSPNLLADFGFLARSVSIDYETDSAVTMFAYDDADNLLGSSTGGEFAGTLTFSTPSDAIRRVVVDMAPRSGADFGSLDKLVIESGGPTPVPEHSTMALFAIGGLPLTGALLRRRR